MTVGKGSQRWQHCRAGQAGKQRVVAAAIGTEKEATVGMVEGVWEEDKRA